MPRCPSGNPDSCLQQIKIEFRGVLKANYVRRILFSICAIAILSTWPMAETPYENAAKVDMKQLASSILAASLCKGVQFHSDAVMMSVAAAS
jgi:hypothetical protein